MSVYVFSILLNARLDYVVLWHCGSSWLLVWICPLSLVFVVLYRPATKRTIPRLNVQFRTRLNGQNRTKRTVTRSNLTELVWDLGRRNLLKPMFLKVTQDFGGTQLENDDSNCSSRYTDRSGYIPRVWKKLWARSAMRFWVFKFSICARLTRNLSRTRMFADRKIFDNRFFGESHSFFVTLRYRGREK